MKILDVSANPVAACVSFDYRGFTLSLSAIFTPSNMRVFKGKQDVTHLFAVAPFRADYVAMNGLAATVDNILSVTRAIDSLFLVREVTGEDPLEAIGQRLD